MFQFALVRALFAFTYHRPALPPLFTFPRPCHEKAGIGPFATDPHKTVF